MKSCKLLWNCRMQRAHGAKVMAWVNGCGAIVRGIRQLLGIPGVGTEWHSVACWRLYPSRISTGFNKTVPTVTWLLHAFSFWLPSLVTVISRNRDHHWPFYLPDLSPLDFSFWAQGMTHLCRGQSSTLNELEINIDEAILWKMAARTKWISEAVVGINKEATSSTSSEHNINVQSYI